jgi:hypothetical protein
MRVRVAERGDPPSIRDADAPRQRLREGGDARKRTSSPTVWWRCWGWRSGALKRKLTLVFGHFGWRSLAAEARRERWALEELLSAAAGYFHSELGTGRAALQVPRAGRRPQGHGSTIELALPAGVWRDLEAEAARQRVAVGRLLEHAALYYLAAVDSGREATWTATGLA